MFFRPSPDLKRHLTRGILSRDGGHIPIGAFDGERIGLYADGLVLHFSPPGTGAVVCLSVPALLSDIPQAIAARDHHGDLFEITAGHRASLGPVWRLDWTGRFDSESPDGRFPRWNPLAAPWMPTDGPGQTRALGVVAATLLGGTRLRAPTATRLLLDVLLACLMRSGRFSAPVEPTLGALVALFDRLLDTRDPMMELDSIFSEHPYVPEVSLARAALHPDNLSASLVDLALALAPLRHPVIQERTSASDFDPSALTSDLGTIYVSDDLHHGSAVVTALFFEMCAFHLLQARSTHQWRSHKLRATLHIDDVHTLPPLPTVADLAVLGPPRFLNAVLTTHDIEALTRCFGAQTDTLMNHAMLTIIRRTHNPETAQRLAERMGRRTPSHLGKALGLEAGGPVCTAHDLMALPVGKQVVYGRGLQNQPVVLDERKYFEERRFERKARSPVTQRGPKPPPHMPHASVEPALQAS